MADFFRNVLQELRNWRPNGDHTSAEGMHDQASSQARAVDKPVMTSRLTWQDILSDASEEIVKKARASTVAMDDTLQYIVTKVELLIPPGLHSEGRALLSGPEKYLTKNFKTYLTAKDGDSLINIDQLTQLVVRLVGVPDPVLPFSSRQLGDSEPEELVTYNNPRLENTLNNRLTIVLAARVDTHPEGKTRGQIQAEFARSKANVGVVPRRSGTHDLVFEVDGVVKIIDLFPAIVGKGEECDLRLSNEHVSRKHLIIDLDEDSRPRITQKATNDTFLNGKELRLDEKAMLGDSGVIELVHLAAQGGVLLSYRSQVRGGSAHGSTPIAAPAAARSALTPPAVPRDSRPTNSQDVGTNAEHTPRTDKPSHLGTGITKIAQPGITSRRSPIPTRATAVGGLLTLQILNIQGAVLQTFPIASLPQQLSVGGANLEFLESSGADVLMVDVRRGGLVLLDANGAPGRTVGKHSAEMYRWAANQTTRLPDGSIAILRKS